MGDEQEKRTKRRRGRRRQHRAKELPNIFFCGDPHGEFAHINEAARLYKPDAMVILGDSQPSAPLEELLGEAMSLTDIWWIPGNHDTDTDEYFDYLWRGPLASHNLHGRVTTVAGLRIAGLGGVFRGQIWMPDEEPNYFSPAHFIRRSPKVNIWRGGLPRRHRSTIFPSVYNYLMHQKADILITHEAPSCHAKGFEALDRLAQSLGVKWFFHGHQHEDRVYGMQNGCLTRAVGFRGIVNLQGEVIVPAQMDPRETVALQEAFDWAARTQAPEGFEPGKDTRAPIIWEPTHRGPDAPLDAGIFTSGVEPDPKIEALSEEVAMKTPVARFKPEGYVVRSGRRLRGRRQKKGDAK